MKTRIILGNDRPERFNRNYVGFELNAEYIKIAERKLKRELGMFM